MSAPIRTNPEGKWTGLTVAACLSIFVFAYFSIKDQPTRGFSPEELAPYIDRLKSAEHVEAHTSARKQSIRITKELGIRKGALNALGMEVRDVRNIVNGEPYGVFTLLSFLGGYGEIIWVDAWTNFPVNLASNAVPRREAVRATLEAVQATGASMIDAGHGRHLVVKNSEIEEFDAAINILGWRDGVAPPWEQPGEKLE